MTANIPFRDRISCTISEACEATGLGRTKIYEKISAGRIRTAKVDTRTLIVVASLVALIDPGSNAAATASAGAESEAA